MTSSFPKYDVFLSSSKDEFSYFLYKELESQGVLTLRGDQEFEEEDGTETTSSLIELAIEESRLCIVVFSPTYASSPRRLEQLSQICEIGNAISTVFHLVNPPELRKQTGTIGESFYKHEQEFREDSAKVQRWREAVTRVSSISGWSTENWDPNIIIGSIVAYVLKKVSYEKARNEVSKKKLRPWLKKVIEQPTEAELIPHISGVGVNEEISINVNEEINDHIEAKSTTDASVEWIFLFGTLLLELISAGFDQAASPSKPKYALIGMLLAIAAVLISIWELIRKESLVVKRWQKLQCIYYLHPSNTFFYSLPDVFGLVTSISQCVFSIVQYVYFKHHADNPIRLSVLPAIFQMCLAGSMLYRNKADPGSLT